MLGITADVETVLDQVDDLLISEDAAADLKAAIRDLVEIALDEGDYNGRLDGYDEGYDAGYNDGTYDGREDCE